ncbi:MAG: hypothetical protein JWM44_4566 [Bacilli bacterium]|jgi:hypothetical protein|nr:hypothetical protein [Bacilli bacterium]
MKKIIGIQQPDHVAKNGSTILEEDFNHELQERKGLSSG